MPGTLLEKDWVIDLDIQKFFDSVPWDLIVKAVEANTTDAWVMLYVKRWLAAPLQLPDGTLAQRDRGTPQGSAVSPVLANLFMHYAFDMWLARKYPAVPFERYADDAVVHCVTERQARMVAQAIGERMEQVGLRLHPEKTRIVYCKDGTARLGRAHVVHLPGVHVPGAGHAHQAREDVHRVRPGGQQGALKKISAEVRSWRLHQHTGYTIGELARWINPVVRGWMQYYGAFYRSALYPLLKRINGYLVRWLRKKYKRLKTFAKAHAAWGRAHQPVPGHLRALAVGHGPLAVRMRRAR